VIFDNQLRHATAIVSAYQGGTPLHTWLKDFFRDNKQMGSRDRRLLSNMVYGFYRLGHALRELPVEERLLTGLFLCNDNPQDLLQYFKPDWNARITRPLPEKIAFYQGYPHHGRNLDKHPDPRQDQPSDTGFNVTDIFPWKKELSEDIDHEAFCLSFLRQPDLFLRIRPGYEAAVRQRLEGRDRPDPSLPHKPSAGDYEFIPPSALRLPNGIKVEDFFTPDKEVVIQDLGSQQIASFLQLPGTASPSSFWDACAASGGKSLLAHDLYPHMQITVSDIRESILRNLQQRFIRAGINKYRSFVVDLTLAPFDNAAYPYQLILADAPCTGSGTWSRTPEDLYFFDPKKILHYSEIQRKIVTHLAPRLSNDAYFVYSTCSVFKKENEEIAALVREKFGLHQDRMENIKGYDRKADSMFAARFRA
jgi:16S rRNA (cytosine967-C5)-methyltransferase